MNIRTRFAPSPTGYLHIGGLRTALYCYLWAKHNSGEYILRIEDTDRGRYVEGSVENLITSLNYCGIQNDEGPVLSGGKLEETGKYGPYFQSERLDIYKKHIDKLLEEGKAYYCFCSKERLEKLREEQMQKKETPKYDSKCSSISLNEAKKRVAAGEEHVVRMKLPENQDITFYDEVRGEVKINTSDIDEQVLIKADGFPTYHFAVVIDDHFMKVNYIIRGEEWLVSTPKHIILYDYLGFEKPKFAHLPTVLNKDKKKLSKRQDSVAVEDFIKKGYLPEALVNYIALLGWSDPDGKEILSMDELINSFDIGRVNKAGAVFDTEKLGWVNSHYIKEKSDKELIELCRPYLKTSGLIDDETSEKTLLYIIGATKDKINYLEQIVPLTEELYSAPDFNNLEEKAKEAMEIETNAELFSLLISMIEENDEITPENMGAILKVIGKEHKIKGKALYMPARIAVSGIMHGPDLTYVMSVLGKDTVLKRLKEASDFVK